MVQKEFGLSGGLSFYDIKRLGLFKSWSFCNFDGLMVRFVNSRGCYNLDGFELFSGRGFCKFYRLGFFGG